MKKSERQQLLEASAGIENPKAQITIDSLKVMLRKVVKKAKRTYYQEVINELDEDSIFGAMKWPTSVRQYTTSPIQCSDRILATSSQGKQKALRLELLTPPKSTLNSIVREQREFYTESRAYIIEWNTCMRQEVQEAIFHAGNTSLSSNETPLFVIKKAWPVYMEQITLLFQLFLQEGYHPLAFKNAILCVLPKPGKRPRHLLHSYGLIALLSCLGNALERIVARRPAAIALKSRQISLLHFGAIPG